MLLSYGKEFSVRRSADKDGTLHYKGQPGKLFATKCTKTSVK